MSDKKRMKKLRKKRVKSLKKQVEKHEKKVKEGESSNEVKNYWRKEIDEKFLTQINEDEEFLEKK